MPRRSDGRCRVTMAAETAAAAAVEVEEQVAILAMVASSAKVVAVATMAKAATMARVATVATVARVMILATAEGAGATSFVLATTPQREVAHAASAAPNSCLSQPRH